jgi:hypothetical protein
VAPLRTLQHPSSTLVLPAAEYYPKVTSSRKYEDRLETLENVRQAGISVCAGGIIGLGEGQLDRVGLLHQVGGRWSSSQEKEQEEEEGSGQLACQPVVYIVYKVFKFFGGMSG